MSEHNLNTTNYLFFFAKTHTNGNLVTHRHTLLKKNCKVQLFVSNKQTVKVKSLSLETDVFSFWPNLFDQLKQGDSGKKLYFA